MKKWRTIIMSDLHLGARQSQTDKIYYKRFIHNTNIVYLLI
jgi:hypothetical protein